MNYESHPYVMKKYFANKIKVENFDGIKNKILYIYIHAVTQGYAKKKLFFGVESTKSISTI